MIARALLCALAVATVAHAADEAPPVFNDFYNVSIGNYQVLSQSGRPIGNDANWFMNQMLLQYSKFFSNWRAKDRARVIVFSNLADFRTYAVSTTKQMHSNLAGFCHLTADADGNQFFELVTYQHDSLWRVLAHEGFHQFVFYELGTSIPIWLNEGLAQYFETSYILHGKLSTGDISKPMLQVIQALIKAGKAPSIDELIRMNQPTFYARSELDYPTAWALAYFLLHRENEKYEDGDMKRYFQDLKFSKDPVASFYNRFGRDPKALQQEFNRYILGLRARFD